MKKSGLIFTSIATILLSTSVLAAENKFYIKANAGVSKLNRAYDKSTWLTMRSKTIAFFGAGLGYNIMDNVRVDLTLEHFVNPQLKKTGNVNYQTRSGVFRQQTRTVKHKANINSLMINGYVDVFNIGVVKVFAGAGVGLAQVKEKISRIFGDSTTRTDSIKKANNIAYQATLGVSAAVLPGVNAELSYSWKDFGKTKLKMTPYGNRIGKTGYKGHHAVVGIRLDI